MPINWQEQIADDGTVTYVKWVFVELIVKDPLESKV